MADPAALAQAWDEVARAYDVYFGPRFAPWAASARSAVDAAALPQGPILAPCCGPGRELIPLAHGFPDREIVGIDLSAKMIALAQVRVAGNPLLRVEVGDASELAGRFAPAAAVISALGFQQLPDPCGALAQWCGALAPGGVASICFWASAIHDCGPFALAGMVFCEHLDPPPPREWEGRLGEVVADAGCELLRDESVAHTLAHDGPAEFWDAMVNAGPWRAMVHRVGDSKAEAMRATFIERHPPGPISHRPSARLLVARRRF